LRESDLEEDEDEREEVEEMDILEGRMVKDEGRKIVEEHSVSKTTKI
jgi:hypothetical protein